MSEYVERGSAPPDFIDEQDPPGIAMLKEEHRMFRALFDMVETVDRRALFPVAGETCVRLAIHMAVEEELFYPSLRRVMCADKIDEAIAEHQLAKRLISEIMEMTGVEGQFRTKLNVLGEEIMHHIDGEDRELFRDVRRAWEDGAIDLVEIDAQMQARRRELLDLVKAAATHSRDTEIEPIGEAMADTPRRVAEARSSKVEEDT
jgi:hemerythrin-like domain-containing protein